MAFSPHSNDFSWLTSPFMCISSHFTVNMPQLQSLLRQATCVLRQANCAKQLRRRMQYWQKLPPSSVRPKQALHTMLQLARRASTSWENATRPGLTSTTCSNQHRTQHALEANMSHMHGVIALLPPQSATLLAFIVSDL